MKINSPSMDCRKSPVMILRSRFIALLLSFSFFIPVHAQTQSRVNLGLQRKLEAKIQQGQPVELFVSGDTTKIKDYVTQVGGQYKYAIRNIASVVVPADKVEDFAGQSFIQRIEDGEIPLQPLMDKALINNNILPVHNGDAPLNLPYKGDDVVIGIIDAGIYFQHPDFQKQDGSTRIRWLWDMTSTNSTNSPQPYGYGQEWSAQDIDNGLCTHVEPANQFGHGTNVAGIAAGDGSAVGNYKGVAPRADLIVVAFDFNAPFLSRFVDAVDYIFKKADAMGKPCVINASVGTYQGSHDARDFAALMIESLLEERHGRALVCAAGNAGNIDFHLGYDVTGDTAFTWFTYNTSTNDIFIELWADTADFNSVYFAFGADNPSTFQHYGRTDFLNIPRDYHPDGTSGVFLTKNLLDGTNFIGTITTYAELIGDVYLLQAQIVSASPNYYWRFITTGSGRFDIWANSSLIFGFPDMVTNVPPDSVVPDVIHYRFPDNQKTIVSSFSCSDKVITVANYSNRAWYIDYNNDTVYLNETEGALFLTSSRGPTRDNRQKPDIAATGSTTIATGNLNNISALLSTGQAFKVAPGGMHNRNGGTSMASPIVAGIAALYLDKNPDAGYREINGAIRLSARQDNFTGTNLPDDMWGYGKADGFGALTQEVVLGCTDSTAFNYNPLANVDDGSCVPVVYGCTDSLALNYNPDANTDDGSCLYDTTGIASSQHTFDLKVVPNPAKNTLLVYINAPGNLKGAELRMVDITGRTVLSKPVSGANPQYVKLTGRQWSGVFHLMMVDQHGTALASRKIIVE